MRSITVYCSSSRHVAKVYFDAAAELGGAIATAGWDLVYGGNNVGLMQAVADAARLAGGKVIGITPRRMSEEGLSDPHCHELVITTGMRERKALLEARGDAFIALPGGVGTFEEWFEILVGRTLGYHDKPLILLNVNSYYDPLLAMMEHGIEQGFIRPATRSAFYTAKTAGEAVGHLKSTPTGPAASMNIAMAPSALE